ncbi:acetyl-CoA carboxylase biotin carboxyl carrier protein subunit [Aliibacillus thermotolerans]|uniref:Acetyl-CoA carboxylase biotin carboxyl carrier protein subunit n=1 Tax=Aliibacillus thermotolerans TaxID=1834418 RepID=A0ABW0U5N1_9BACI|nr:acetyl-CoA carboxylase biotin carboxyl carrier protein subunit [Aliibacillus thermotolerans]MDA3128569.1 acetyl-CoA carboxylase biotin carboxyl carrier protein subunit [Aliibacillus thermotolerans]
MTMIKSSMAGNLWKLLVQPGDTVEAGQEVAILESMKMEIPIEAETAGTVKNVMKAEGEFVNEGDDLVELE